MQNTVSRSTGSKKEKKLEKIPMKDPTCLNNFYIIAEWEHTFTHLHISVFLHAMFYIVHNNWSKPYFLYYFSFDTFQMIIEAKIIKYTVNFDEYAINQMLLMEWNEKKACEKFMSQDIFTQLFQTMYTCRICFRDLIFN